MCFHTTVHRLLGRLLSKCGHGIFNVRKELGVRYAPEGVTGIDGIKLITVSSEEVKAKQKQITNHNKKGYHARTYTVLT